MRSFLTILLIITCYFITFGQSNESFEIINSFIKDSSQRKTFNDFIRKDSVFYQDEKYIVRKTCYGEFGGAIWFKNKNSGVEYSCRATCPVSVNKINNKYIVTTTIAHFSYYYKIFEIENPDSMELFQPPESEINNEIFAETRYLNGGVPASMENLNPKKQSGYTIKITSHSRGDDLTNSIKGTTSIIDSSGILILISFPFKEQLYHIVTDYAKRMMLSQIRNNKLVTIDTIYDNLNNLNRQADGYIEVYSTEPFQTKDNHYVVLFKNPDLVGFLDIYENKIRFKRYK